MDYNQAFTSHYSEEVELGEKGGAFFNGKEEWDDFRKNISLRRLRGKITTMMHNFNDIQIIIMGKSPLARMAVPI